MNLPRYVLFFCGQLGLMTLLRFFFTWIVRYCTNPVPGVEQGARLVDVVWVGYVLLAFRLFDGVTDPIAGAVSDGWTRRGRERRALLWFAFLVPPLGLVLCFAANLELSVALRWALLVVGMFVFFVGYTFYAIPYWSLIDDYGQDADQRRRLSNLLGAGMLGATALGSVLSGPAIAKLGYLWAAVAFALPCGVLMILPFFGRPPAPAAGAAPDGAVGGPVGEAPAEGKAEEEGLITGFFSALRHRRFLATLFLFAGSQMSFTVLTTCTVYMMQHTLHSAQPEVDTSKVLACFLGTAILTFAAVPALSRRVGWQQSVVVASVALGGVYALTALLGQGLIGTPLDTACVLFALGGPMAAVVLGMEGEAIAACARERGEGVISMYFGVFNFVVKALNGVAMAISTALVALVDPSELGSGGARLMGPTAGALLVLGVGVYFVLRPREAEGAAPAPAV